MRPDPARAKASARRPVPEPAPVRLSDEEDAELQRIADAMNKTTDISAFEITAKGALEAEPDRALQELAIIGQRLKDPAVRAQLDRMVGRLAAEPAIQAAIGRRLGGAPDAAAPSGDLLAGPDEPDTLTGGGGRDAFGDWSDPTTVQLAQGASAAPAPAPIAHPDLAGVDLDFVVREEGGLKTAGYIPTDGAGRVIGRSGVTVGAGVDLGQMNAQDLTRLETRFGLPPALAAKLAPYLDRRGAAAQQALAARPLQLTRAEADAVSVAKYREVLAGLKRGVAAVRGPNGFDALPAPVKTVLFSMAVNLGPNFLATAPRFSAHLKAGDVAGMIGELNAFYNYTAPNGLLRRRREERLRLEKALRNGRLTPRF